MKHIEECNEGIMARIRDEYREVFGLPPSEIFKILIERYEEIKDFEKERGMTVTEMHEFVKKHQDTIFEVKRLVKELEKLMNLEEKLRRQVGELKSVKDAYTAGFNAGRNAFGIWVYCSICGQPSLIQPNSQEHAAIIQFFREKGWAHVMCQQMGQMQFR